MQRNFPHYWVLITAFILFSVYTLAQHAYMINIPDNTEKMRHVYSMGIIGCLLGVLILPFLLPLKILTSSERLSICPSNYKLRLILTASFFLPNIIIRFLGEEAYLSNTVNSGIMALGNGVTITLMFGLYFSMIGKYRLLWTALAFSAGNLTFNFCTGQGQQILQPFLFKGLGLILTITGILLLIYLTLNRFCDTQKEEEIAEPDNSRIGFLSAESKPERLPYFLFPLIAAFIIFITNSFTNQLFFMVLNSPLTPGLNFSNITFILTLPLLGFLAALSWRNFLMVFIPVCSVILLLAPSLLLFTHSQPLFLVLYTLNTITVRMITAVFPFIILDMYRLYANKIKTRGLAHNPLFIIILGALGWLLPVSINMISMSVLIPRNLFNLIQHDKPTAVTLLTIAAIVFYILMWFANKNPAINSVNGTLETKSDSSEKNLKTYFKEYQLTNKEIEVACLLFEEGITSEEIASRIFRSTATVSSHLTNIFRKLNVQSRTEFMAKVKKV